MVVFRITSIVDNSLTNSSPFPSRLDGVEVFAPITASNIASSAASVRVSPSAPAIIAVRLLASASSAGSMARSIPSSGLSTCAFLRGGESSVDGSSLGPPGVCVFLGQLVSNCRSAFDGNGSLLSHDPLFCKGSRPLSSHTSVIWAGDALRCTYGDGAN